MCIKRELLAGAVVVVMGLSASSAGAAEAPPPEPAARADRPNSQTLASKLRDCPPASEGEPVARGQPSSDVRCVARALDTFADRYRDRALRRQSQSDVASGIGTVSMMALLAGGAGAAATTTAAWSFGATTPLVVDDLRAPRYRGMLDVAGALALNNVADRYRRLDVRARTLTTAQKGDEERSDAIRRTCDGFVSARVTVRELPEDSRRTLLVSGLDEIVARCWDQVRASETLLEYGELWRGEGSVLAARAAADGLEVSRRLDMLDRSMRTTPFEAIRTTAAAPFLTVGNVIKGEQTAFTGRDDPRKDRDYVIELRSLGEAPELPAELKTETVVTAAMQQALVELAAAEKKKKGGGLSVRLADVSTRLNSGAEGLVAWAQRLNAERRLALRVAELDADHKVNVDPRLLTSKVEAAPAAPAGPAPAKAESAPSSTE